MQIEIDFSIFLPNVHIIKQYQEILHPGSFESINKPIELDKRATKSVIGRIL